MNCATVPADNLELKLFGQSDPSGDTFAPKGYYNQALGGTLFLDEIADLPGPAQLTLVRLLESSKNLGGSTRHGVRILAGSQKDLVQLIDEGKFRLDLYHLLSVILVHLPSLQQRREDIPMLAGIYLNRICKQYQLPSLHIESDALRALQGLPWTGNLRELKNAVERLAILAGPNITRKDVQQLIQPIVSEGYQEDWIEHQKQAEHQSLISTLEEDNFQRFKELTEKIFVELKLKEHQWNIAKT
ncbi:MAG: sigma-54-dependent transcriptional regulator, partial [Bacteroidota bacterium]